MNNTKIQLNLMRSLPCLRLEYLVLWDTALEGAAPSNVNYCRYICWTHHGPLPLHQLHEVIFLHLSTENDSDCAC